MATLYADLPVKPNSDEEPVWDEELEHSDPVLFPGDELTWRLVSDTYSKQQLNGLEFKFERIEENTDVHECESARTPLYPTDVKPKDLGWSKGREMKTKIKGHSNGKRVFPKKDKPGTEDACDCKYHAYRAVFLVRERHSDSDGNPVDPHVRFHRDDT